jgi:anti-sigma regulatory factor (Ser/Thr protein kinase)
MKRRTQEIRKFILENIDDYGNVRVNEAVKKFEVSRQAIFKNIRILMQTGLIIKTESEKHPYELKPLHEKSAVIPVGPDTEENKVWTEFISPSLNGLKDNIREICQYGFTEMFNNVIDHSQSQSADVWVRSDALVVRLTIQDHGIGIWKKLQQELHLDDPRHALLELTKGKVTSDPRRHTGEGIFFTSRMFDKFILASDKLTFCRFQEGEEWLFDVIPDNSGPGTKVTMTLYLDSEKTPKDIFDKFTVELDDFGFTRTHLSVQLAKYEGDHLVSRSQARRLLSRLEKFKEVILDFRNVTAIGQAFADEIFRVFQNEHPSILLVPTHTTPEVEGMINRAIAHEGKTERPLPK